MIQRLHPIFLAIFLLFSLEELYAQNDKKTCDNAMISTLREGMQEGLVADRVYQIQYDRQNDVIRVAFSQDVLDQLYTSGSDSTAIWDQFAYLKLLDALQNLRIGVQSSQRQGLRRGPRTFELKIPPGELRLTGCEKDDQTLYFEKFIKANPLGRDNP